VHADFSGGVGSAVRFRPARLLSGELPVELQARFGCDGREVRTYPVLDVGSAGFAAAVDDDLNLEPGTPLQELVLSLGAQPLWSGTATVVHATPGRIGVRFDGGTLDLQRVRLRATLEGRMAVLRAQRERLPASWRAAVSDVRQQLEDARLEVEEFERAGHDDPLRRAEQEDELFAGLRAHWGQAYYAALADLHAQTLSLDEEQRGLAQGYATAALMPLLMACPLHKRAYEKPLGYAGDYRMMELYFAREMAGDTLFGRLLHSVAQNYTLGRSVRARSSIMREAVREVIRVPTSTPARILSLAAGPALELTSLFEQAPEVNRPVDLVLLDQDAEAHETAHRRLTRILMQRAKDAPAVSLSGLHFSVRQMLRPQTPQDRAVVDETLRQLDLVYSAGLYDYLPDPVAARLTHVAYAGLRPGGRLLLGNLVVAPDTTWLMDYVLGWQLRYRTPESMLGLADGLSPVAARVGITADATGHCIFLDVTRP
jgi:hypothetical protein